MRAMLACEGLYLTAEEEDLFDAMETERLTPEQRNARIIALDKERHARRKRNAPATQRAGDHGCKKSLNSPRQSRSDPKRRWHRRADARYSTFRLFGKIGRPKPNPR